MSFGDRLGLAGLIVALLGIAAFYLCPTKKWIGWLCFAAASFLGIAWVWYEFRPPVTVAPESASFNVPFTNDTYTFTITNMSDQDRYAVGFKFRVHSDQLSGDDFSIDLAPGSRKPLGDAAPGFADIHGFRALDNQGHPLFYLQIHRLAAHDRREITITRLKLGLATISAESDFSTITPQPIVMQNGQIGGPLRVNEEMKIISPIAFNSESSAKDIGARPQQAR